jgi:hypothetical protein
MSRSETAAIRRCDRCGYVPAAADAPTPAFSVLAKQTALFRSHNTTPMPFLTVALKPAQGQLGIFT